MDKDEKIMVVLSEPSRFDMHGEGTAEMCEKCEALCWFSNEAKAALLTQYADIVAGRTGNSAMFAIMQRSILICVSCTMKSLIEEPPGDINIIAKTANDVDEFKENIKKVKQQKYN